MLNRLFIVIRKKCNAIIDLSSSVETINYTDGVGRKNVKKEKLSLNGFRLIFLIFSAAFFL